MFLKRPIACQCLLHWGNKEDLLHLGSNLHKNNSFQVIPTCERVKPFAPGRSMASVEVKLMGDTTRLPVFPVFLSCLNKVLPNLLPAVATNKEGG